MLANKHFAVSLMVAASAFPLSAHSNEPVQVLTTIGMIGNIAAEIAGDCASVSSLMGAGIDPHMYQATARDVIKFNNADLILYSGNGLEGQLSDVLERLNARKPTIAVTEQSIPLASLIEQEDYAAVDPHLWMDASLWALTVPTVASALTELAPTCEAQFTTAASTLRTQIEALHQWVELSVATIPQEQRILVTAHDAFSYYGRAYGIQVTGIQGISTQAEASISNIRDTAQYLIDHNIPAIFVESTINPRTIQAVIDAAAQSGHKVEIGGELYSDAMGEDGTPDGTYIGMIYANTKNIVLSLGGTLATMPQPLADWANHWDVN